MSATKKVLIVEDERPLSRVIEKRLAMEGYTVCTSHTGEGVLDIIRSERPNFVLIDLIMPKVDGFEVLTELQADTMLSGAVVIVFSNLTQDIDRERVMKLGASEFLDKSDISLVQLVETLKKYD